MITTRLNYDPPLLYYLDPPLKGFKLALYIIANFHPPKGYSNKTYRKWDLYEMSTKTYRKWDLFKFS